MDGWVKGVSDEQSWKKNQHLATRKKKIMKQVVQLSKMFSVNLRHYKRALQQLRGVGLIELVSLLGIGVNSMSGTFVISA